MSRALCLWMALIALPASGQDTPLVLSGARILPVDGAAIEDGTLVVQSGRIVALGARDAVEVPEGATIRDLSGKVLMPGLVCTHSHVGAPSGGDRSGPIHPDCRALDAIDVRHPSVHRARAGGLTTLNIMPGSGHLLSGQTVYLKLRAGRTIEELAIRTQDGAIAGGIKMANGTNSQRAAPFPGTRAKSAALMRARLVEAQEYRARKERAARGEGEAPPRDLGLEALVEALAGKRIVHHHTHRHDDILTVLRLAKEFGFRVVLHHVSEGWKVAAEIAAAGAPCSAIIVDSPGGKLEARDLSFEVGRILDEAGVLVAFHTDDPITDSRLFLRMAALAVRAGMDRTKALRSLTLSGAEMLDLEGRVGSLTPGKDADFVVLSGEPLSVYTRVLETWIEGRKVFDLARPEDRLFADGGEGAGHERATGLCCFENGEDQR